MAGSKIVKNASIVMLFSLVAKFSSFIVELLIASNLGASRETDAFYMVHGIVQIIYPMISVGIWKVYLPEYKTRNVLGNQEAANEITNQLLTIFTFIAGSIILTVLLAPRPIIFLFAPGFDDSALQISENLLRIVIFIIIFNTLATFSSAILQSNEIFSKSQLKEVVFHLPTLIYLVVFQSNSTVTGLAQTIVAGAISSSIVTYWFARSKYRFHFPKKVVNQDIVTVLKQVPIACLNSIINQLNNIVNKMFASTLPVGAITYLNYGSKLIHLFDGIFSTAISTALFPYVTELIAKQDYEKLRKFLKNYIVMISMIIIPISFIIMLYSNEIVGIIFGHGKFGEDSVRQTALVLFMYSIGLLFMCVTTIINDVFYILKRTKILLWTTILNILFNIALDFSLIKIFGVAGLSLATTISVFLSLTIKFFCIKDIFKPDYEIFKLMLTVVFFCLLSSIAPFYLKSYLQTANWIKFVVSMTIFILTYLILALVIDKDMRMIFMSSVKSFSKGGAKNNSLLEDIALDRKNNSTKSFFVLLFYRLLHRSFVKKHIGLRLALFSLLKGAVFFLLRIDAQISYKAIIGKDIRLPHSAMGVIISAKAVIEDHQTIYHQVTIGINENLPVEKQPIIIHENCYLSVGCKVISCEVGSGSKIGPNAVVYKDLPENSLYVSTNQYVSK